MIIKNNKIMNEYGWDNLLGLIFLMSLLLAAMTIITVIAKVFRKKIDKIINYLLELLCK